MKMNVKKLERRSIIFIIISFLLAFVIATSLLWTPKEYYDCDVDKFQAVNTLLPANATEILNCTVDEVGNFQITADDPNLIYHGLSNTGRIVMVRFAQPLTEKMLVEVFPNTGYGFNETEKLQKEVLQGDTYVYFVFANGNYTDLRIDIGANCQIAGIELGNEGIIEKNATENPYWFVCAVGFAILIAVAAYVLEQKKNVAAKIVVWFKEHKADIGKSIVSLIIFLVIAAVVSLVVCEVLNDIHFKSIQGLYTYLMVTALVFLVLCGVACLWNSRKTLIEDFEKVFVRMTLIVGLGMIVLAPFAHLSWDTDSHYWWAVEASYLGDTKFTKSDYMVSMASGGTLIKGTAEENFVNMGRLTVADNDIIYEEDGGISLPHLPSGIFLALGRLFGLPFIFNYMLGKIPNLLIYTAMCYLGMKQLKDGKLLLAVIALFPTNILLATNYSYDYWVTGFSIFGMAYFVGLLQDRERKATAKDAFVMSASFALACLPKLIYFPLLLILFLLPQNKIENRKKYYGIVILILVALMAMFMIESLVQTTGPGDTRGGSDVGPADQLAFIFGDIFGYAFILLRFLFTEYLTIGNMPAYISHFAYLGVASGSIIIQVLLLVTLLFDRNEAYTKETRPNWLNRIYVVLMYLGGSALVATALYVAYTPVGNPTVLGCQARYIVPWLYPLLSIWNMNRIKPVISKKALCWSVVLGCYGLIFYDLATVFLPSVACWG